MNRSKQLYILLFTALSAFALFSCEPTSSSSDYEPISVTGLVTDAQQTPVENAIVRIINPRPEKVTTTNADGNYSFELQVDSTITYTIEIRKEGFETKEHEFLAIPERTVKLSAFRLSAEGTENNDDDDSDEGGETPPGVIGEPTSIYLQSVSETEIGVQSTGQIENSQLVFQAVDEYGSPLTSVNAVDVTFSLGANPDGDITLSTDTATTNANGQAHLTVTSGTTAGVVQVIAEFEGENGTARSSKPVQLVIHAGHPSQDHFTILLNDRNKSMLISEEIPVSVRVGDKYGNAVADGTAVYFTTDGGYIYGSAFTSAGTAESQLTIANPIPPNGIATITASTADDNEQPVTASAQMVFSRSPIISVTPETFDIANAEDLQFTYSVMDFNGFPMEPGTTISVTVEGNDIEVLGDVDITVGDLNSGISNISELTNYTFILDDANPDETNDTPVQITIEVDGPNGSARKTLTGRKAKVRP